ncbi:MULTISPECIES: ABC transporter substrate-binding protein [unclassified Pseudomonas]|uniref:substrate-binding periplasmic protein n=1 Tax=unclassified Pseudomonas TaxID=196821 RepID=UPI001EDDE168|nr:MULTISPECIES: transporter substrate-binding domain-containing protein [unclassified Pseudomonas]MCG4455420.1 transporter substrate-binding domain-containing protein [Pseudomonas sp. MMS21 TM103]
MHSGVSRRLLAVLASLALLLPPLALARELLAVGSDFPRVFERSGAGVYQGLGPDVLRQVLEPRGYSLRFASYPWARAQRMVELGRADILIGPYRNPAREARFAFVGPAFYRDRIVLYCRSGRSCQWSGDLRQLSGRRIGVVRAWAYGARFDSARDVLELVTVEGVGNGLKMLSLGRLELLASNQRNTLPLLQVLGLTDEISQLEPPVDTLDGYFAFPLHSSHARLREDFDEGFRQLVERGQLARLAAQWQVDIP